LKRNCGGIWWDNFFNALIGLCINSLPFVLMVQQAASKQVHWLIGPMENLTLILDTFQRMNILEN